jgi:hypothetical protein
MKHVRRAARRATDSDMAISLLFPSLLRLSGHQAASRFMCTLPRLGTYGFFGDRPNRSPRRRGRGSQTES